MTNETDPKAQALATFLECDLGDVEESSWDPDIFDTLEGKYLVLTDEEADDRAREQILQSTWAFQAHFLADYTPEGIDEEELEAIRGDRCEDVNDAFLALVKAGRGLDDFVEGAIGADGRGHFLAGYDGEENQEGEYFLYRQ